MNELCEEIYAAKHPAAESNVGGAGHVRTPLDSLPLSRRLLIQTLPLNEESVKAHITSRIVAEQQDLTKLVKQGKPVPETLNIEVIDTFRQETQQEIKAACDRMADAMLARILIESIGDISRIYDLNKVFLN